MNDEDSNDSRALRNRLGSLDELMVSISEKGSLQPMVVRLLEHHLALRFGISSVKTKTRGPVAGFRPRCPLSSQNVHVFPIPFINDGNHVRGTLIRGNPSDASRFNTRQKSRVPHDYHAPELERQISVIPHAYIAERKLSMVLEIPCDSVGETLS